MLANYSWHLALDSEPPCQFRRILLLNLKWYRLITNVIAPLQHYRDDVINIRKIKMFCAVTSR